MMQCGIPTLKDVIILSPGGLATGENRDLSATRPCSIVKSFCSSGGGGLRADNSVDA